MFKVLASLPAPIASDAHVAEYPRVLPLNDSMWAVSSGTGSLYILTETGFTARYDLEIDGALAPFLLYAAGGAGSEFRLLLAHAVVHGDEGEGSRFKPRQTTFELLEVVVDVSKTNGGDSDPEPLHPSWRLPGPDLPYWAVWSNGGWLVLAEEPFGEDAAGKDKVKETPAQRAARLKEEADAKRGLGARIVEEEDDFPEAKTEEVVEEKEEEEVEMEDAEVKPNFSWTQEPGGVTITIPLPTGLSKQDINVNLQGGSVMIAVSSDSLPPSLAEWLSREHSFWSDIQLSDSTWTYDATSGELELILTKSGEDMRWPSVFIPSSDDSDGEDDVPESFGAATLEAIRASFSRAQPVTKSDEEPHGNPPTIPALLREQMDIDSDDDFEHEDGAFADLQSNKGVGRLAVIGHVVDGVPTWSRQPATVLSLPLFWAGPDLPPATGIIVKQAVDGLVFAPSSGHPARTPWTHLATNPALAFVLSSKRDLRLVRHLSTDAGTTVLALDSGSGTGTGNAYVYYAPEDAESARQGVVGVSGGSRGALLGVSVVRVREREVVVALCERSLVVLGGVM